MTILPHTILYILTQGTTEKKSTNPVNEICLFVCLFVIYLTSSCCSSRSETPLSFFFENKKLSTRGSPQIVLQLSVGRNDVWFHSTVLYGTCKTPFNPSALNPFRETNMARGPSAAHHVLSSLASPAV